MRAWHVMQVRTGMELEIARMLQADGHEAVVPVAWRPRTVSRRDKRRVWRPCAKLPGYVTASPGTRARASICAADGVTRVLGRDGAWDSISASEVARMAAMSDLEPDEDPDQPPVYKRGDRVRIVSGPFTGHETTTLAIRKGHIRAAIGRFPIEIGIEHVEHVRETTK